MVQKLPCVFTNRHFDCNSFVCDTTGFLIATSRSLTHSTKTPLAASDGSSAANKDGAFSDSAAHSHGRPVLREKQPLRAGAPCREW